MPKLKCVLKWESVSQNCQNTSSNVKVPKFSVQAKFELSSQNMSWSPLTLLLLFHSLPISMIFQLQWKNLTHISRKFCFQVRFKDIYFKTLLPPNRLSKSFFIDIKMCLILWISNTAPNGSGLTSTCPAFSLPLKKSKIFDFFLINLSIIIEQDIYHNKAFNLRLMFSFNRNRECLLGYNYIQVIK